MKVRLIVLIALFLALFVAFGQVTGDEHDEEVEKVTVVETEANANDGEWYLPAVFR